MEIVRALSIAKSAMLTGVGLATGATIAGLPVQLAYAQAQGAKMAQPCSIPLSRIHRRTRNQDR